MAESTGRAGLRQSLRRTRRELSARQQQQHAQAVARRLLTTRLPLFVRRIALYAPNDGELDPSPLIDAFIDRGRMVALPVVLPAGLLDFYRYTPATRLVRNRFHIIEPDTRTARHVDRRTLDAVCLPLVGFDARGNRLGMGAGYYDATFADPSDRPVMIGLAHALQRVDSIVPRSWDVPLDAVVTESELIVCSMRGERILR